MATPLDLRNRRREAQRAVRLALNTINAGLDAWKAAVADGKAAATSLTNAALLHLHLPALPLGLLEGVPNVRPAALAKLQHQQTAALEELSSCLGRLREAVEGLAAAANSLQHLLEREAAAPLLMERAVFAVLPLRLLGGMVDEVHSMHAAELEVKAAVLRGLQEIVESLREAASGDDTCGGGGGGTGRRAAQREQAVRRTAHVYLSAWVLSPEVDEQRVEAHVAALQEEMRGF